MTHRDMVYWDGPVSGTISLVAGDQCESIFNFRARTDWCGRAAVRCRRPRSPLAGVTRTSGTRLTPLRQPSETSWKSGDRRLPSEIAGNRCPMALASPGKRMTTTQDEMIPELQRDNVKLRQERDSAQGGGAGRRAVGSAGGHQPLSGRSWVGVRRDPGEGAAAMWCGIRHTVHLRWQTLSCRRDALTPSSGQNIHRQGGLGEDPRECLKPSARSISWIYSKGRGVLPHGY
jgi:hypothetical protein